MLSSQQYDAGRLSDTTLKLRRVQQLRKLLEAEGDFPTSGAGIKLEQERLLTNAAAAHARNKALQQSLADAADARPKATVGSMDAKLVALTGAYMSLVRTAFPAWLEQAGPILQQHQWQQDCTVSSWYAGSCPSPAQHLTASQHIPADASRSFRFNIPQPKTLEDHQQQQQQQQLYRQPMQYTLAPQHNACLAGQQHLPAQQAGAAPPQGPVGNILQARAPLHALGQPLGSAGTQQQQQQQGSVCSDPFMESLQHITSQLALLQQALQSHQQQQQQQQQQSVSGQRQPSAGGGSAAAPSQQHHGQQRQQAVQQHTAASAAGSCSPGPAHLGSAAAAGAAATEGATGASAVAGNARTSGQVVPASSNCSSSSSPVAHSAASAAGTATAAAAAVVAPEQQRLGQGQQRQRASQSAGTLATPAEAAQSTDQKAAAAAAATAHTSSAHDTQLEAEVVKYTKGRFTVLQQSPSRPVSRTASMPNSQVPTPRTTSPGAEVTAESIEPQEENGGIDPPQQQQQQQQREEDMVQPPPQQQVLSAAATAAAAAEESTISLGAAAAAGAAVTSSPGSPFATQQDGSFTESVGAAAAAAAGAAAAAASASSPPAALQQQQQREQAAEPELENFRQAVPTSNTDLLQVDAVAVIRSPRPAAAAKGGAPRFSKSPPPPPPLPQPQKAHKQQQQQKQMQKQQKPLQHAESGQVNGQVIGQSEQARTTYEMPARDLARQSAPSSLQQQQQGSPRFSVGFDVLPSWATPSPLRRASAGEEEVAVPAAAPAAAAADGNAAARRTSAGEPAADSFAAAGARVVQQRQQKQRQQVSPRPSMGAASSSPSRRTSTGDGGPTAAGAAAGAGSSLSPTASMHLHQQLVFSPLRLGSASPGAAVSAASTAAAVEHIQQQVGTLANAVSGDMQQLVFSPLRLRSTSLPGPALSPTSAAGAAAGELYDGASTPNSSAASSVRGALQASRSSVGIEGDVFGQQVTGSQQQQQQEQPQQSRLSQHRSSRTSLGESYSGNSLGAGGPLREQEGAGSRRSSIAAQYDGDTAGDGTEGAGQQQTAGRHQAAQNVAAAQNYAAAAAAAAAEVQSPSRAQPGMQTMSQIPQWEQAVFSPLRSGTPAAAAAGTGAVSPGTNGQQGQHAEGLPQARDEIVFSPLRLAAAAGGSTFSGAGGSVGRGFCCNTPSPSPSVQAQSPQRLGRPAGSSSIPLGVNLFASPVGSAGGLSAAAAAAGEYGAVGGSSQSPSSQLVLLPGRGGPQQQQQQQQRLGISSLAVGLGPARSPGSTGGAVPGDIARSTSQHEGSRVIRHSSSSGGAAVAAVGPLHSNLGYTVAGQGPAAGAAAVGSSLASSVHMGLLLSPATRLSLGGASTVDEAAWSSGRPSLGTDGRPSLGADGGEGQHGRLSIGPGPGPVAGAAGVGQAGAGTGPGVTGMGPGVTPEQGAGVGAGAAAAAAAAGGMGGAKPTVMASWSSLSSNASVAAAAAPGGVKVPRLSLPPTLHVPDAPVPGSGTRSGASSHRQTEPNTVPASLEQQQLERQSVGRASVVQQQGSNAAPPPPLPPPPPELLAHLRKSQQLEQQQLQLAPAALASSTAADNEPPPLRRQRPKQPQQQQQQPLVTHTAPVVSSGAAVQGGSVNGSSTSGSTVRVRQGIGSCRVSSVGAAADRDKLVSKVLNTGLTEFSFDDDEEGKGVDSGSEAGAAVEVYSSGSDFSEFGD